ncbi:alpha/beta-hydrolase [Sporormia fimetaria CBS 119925]|uniref:Alpha/beta-hydrolase n=1 Tax=Sporormia fimetaria CBS 119925 TaxID=1340428 RepID=A0A6A6VLF5_9PLEO|nr:alpha/beta-hydrolase [Sporormia fimetaria CBS 119925]
MSVGSWSFNPIATTFPSGILPNVQYFSASNGTWDYQIQVAFPLHWTSTNEASTVDTMYVLDGNALGQTATEAFRRRRPVEFAQPDTIVVSIGYDELIADSPYSLQRGYDFQPPVCPTCPPAPAPGVPSNADNFIEFIDDALRPWIRNTVFPNADFSRDALYGHSFGGLFVLYALLQRPDLFDTFLCASPALYWNNGYILQPSQLAPLTNPTTPAPLPKKPAFQLSYGLLEQYPVKRRTETQAEFETRKSFVQSLQMVTLSNQLFAKIKDSKKLRDVSLRPYPFSDHAAVGAAALADGIDYFLDW